MAPSWGTITKCKSEKAILQRAKIKITLKSRLNKIKINILLRFSRETEI